MGLPSRKGRSTVSSNATAPATPATTAVVMIIGFTMVEKGESEWDDAFLWVEGERRGQVGVARDT